MASFRRSLVQSLATALGLVAVACGSDTNTLGTVDMTGNDTTGGSTAGGATNASTGGGSGASTSGATNGTNTGGSGGATTTGASSATGTSTTGSASGGSTTGSSATGSSATGSSATGSSATGSSATGSSATGTSATTGSVTGGGADAGACPSSIPIGAVACSGSTVCSYGDATCCGAHYSQFTCQCQQGTFFCTTGECNRICPDAGTADAAPADSSTLTTCGTMTCGAGDVCVSTVIQGGACLRPDDAGMCPAGFSPGSQCCMKDPTYTCKPRPSNCGSDLTCACAASTLCPAGYLCSTTSNGVIDCYVLAP